MIEAATMAGYGDTLILDMGETCDIFNLAYRHVEVGGAEPPRILYTGRRPDEKLDEHLLTTASGRAPRNSLRSRG